MTNKKNNLPIQQIVITLLLFILCALTAFFLSIPTNIGFARMIGLNVFGSIAILYNWQLIELHIQRIKENGNGLLFTIIGILVSFSLLLLGENFLNCDMILPTVEDIHLYGHTRLGMFIAYSFIKITFISIVFKCITDRLDIKEKEVQVILFSALVFGLILTLSCTSFVISDIFRTYIYNLLFIGYLSYSYNQTTSLIPGIL
ncbi:MAG: hypothetical protein IJ875_00715, partial [Solobacterium sp.]|nr:hypothetical protein [Solobacterium sp.]